MTLDRVKTQVLILHSERSTLDDLSACVDDRFTVHCATTGTEALQTLGQTPIHVIITAQDLPGMSGIDALREAKKRSPETMGILLADNDSNLEGLAGVKEVFQIIRGGVTSADLNQLIDDATQQLHRVTITESANDTVAEPDESETEHIVMETADNGSTIISDGSGTWSAIKPGTESVDTANDAGDVEILVVSQDEAFIATVQKSSQGVRNIRYANSPAEADAAFAQYPIGVAVVDAAMVGSKVEDLTEHLRARSTRLVCVVAGRRDDGEMLMDLINRGKVYRFLLKPVSPGRARLAIEASVKHHLEAPKTAFRMTGSHIAPVSTPPTAGETGQTAGSIPPHSDARATAAPASQDPEHGASAPPGEDQADTALPALPVAGEGDAVAGERPGSVETDRAASRDRRDRGDRRTSAGIPVFLAAGVVLASAIIAVGILTLTDTDTDTAEPIRQAVPVPRASADSDPQLQDSARSESAPAARIQTLLAVAESAILERRVADAATAADQVRVIDPDNARLPFLTAQIAEMQLRANIDEARAAIRESRFADAASALRAASELHPSDTSEIESVTSALLIAQSKRRVDYLLDRAAASIDQNKLLAPDNDNALYYYQLVLKSDPDNATAKQGLNGIAGKLVLEARNKLDGNQLDRAEELLGEARRLDPSSSEVEASIRLIADARESRLEAERAEAGRQASSRTETADRAASAAAATSGRGSDTRSASDAVDATPQKVDKAGASTDSQTDTMTQDASVEAASDDNPAAAATVAAAGATPTSAAAIGVQDEAARQQTSVADASEQKSLDAAAIAVADGALQGLTQSGPGADSPANSSVGGAKISAARSSTPASSEPTQPALETIVPVSSLTHKKYVAPKYPRSAARRKLSGWVDIVFTVTVDGTTSDIEIRDAKPGDMFVDAASRAVEKWKFEPVIANGAPIEQRAGIRMMFVIEE